MKWIVLIAWVYALCYAIYPLFNKKNASKLNHLAAQRMLVDKYKRELQEMGFEVEFKPNLVDGYFSVTARRGAEVVESVGLSPASALKNVLEVVE